MRINQNIAAMNSFRMLSINQNETSKSLEKLSSGLRINKAADDAAGLAISEKMRGQIRGLDQGRRNAQDTISLVQTAEGALTETHSMLQRMRELAVQASNDTVDPGGSDRNKIQTEMDQLAREITRVSTDTEFNTKKLLNGDLASGVITGRTFQIGANSGQTVEITIENMSASGLGVGQGNSTTGTSVSVMTQSGAMNAITTIQSGINTVSSTRAFLGAFQNRLENATNSLDRTSENLSAAQSRIKDVDMAQEMMNFTKNNVLMQAAQAMLAQANQQPQGVLTLLR